MSYPDRICKACGNKYSGKCVGIDKCPKHPKPYNRREMAYPRKGDDR